MKSLFQSKHSFCRWLSGGGGEVDLAQGWFRDSRDQVLEADTVNYFCDLKAGAFRVLLSEIRVVGHWNGSLWLLPLLLCSVPLMNHLGASVQPGTSCTGGISLDFRDLAMKSKETSTASSMGPCLPCLEERLKVKEWLESVPGPGRMQTALALADTSLLKPYIESAISHIVWWRLPEKQKRELWMVHCRIRNNKWTSEIEKQRKTAEEAAGTCLCSPEVFRDKAWKQGSACCPENGGSLKERE